MRQSGGMRKADEGRKVDAIENVLKHCLTRNFKLCYVFEIFNTS